MKQNKLQNTLTIIMHIMKPWKFPLMLMQWTAEPSYTRMRYWGRLWNVPLTVTITVIVAITVTVVITVTVTVVAAKRPMYACAFMMHA
jgi:hypothetical protein